MTLYVGTLDENGKKSLFISSLSPEDERYEQNCVEFPASAKAQTDEITLGTEKQRLVNVLRHGGARVIQD
jgi:hypothetical protein